MNSDGKLMMRVWKLHERTLPPLLLWLVVSLHLLTECKHQRGLLQVVSSGCFKEYSTAG